jgi:hypothetical protein
MPGKPPSGRHISAGGVSHWDVCHHQQTARRATHSGGLLSPSGLSRSTGWNPLADATGRYMSPSGLQMPGNQPASRNPPNHVCVIVTSGRDVRPTGLIGQMNPSRGGVGRLALTLADRNNSHVRVAGRPKHTLNSFWHFRPWTKTGFCSMIDTTAKGFRPYQQALGNEKQKRVRPVTQRNEVRPSLSQFLRPTHNQLSL